MSKKIDKIVTRAVKNVIEEQEKTKNLKIERSSHDFSFFIGFIAILMGSAILAYAAVYMVSPESMVFSNTSFIKPEYELVFTVGLSVFAGVSALALGLILMIVANGELMKTKEEGKENIKDL